MDDPVSHGGGVEGARQNARDSRQFLGFLESPLRLGIEPGVVERERHLVGEGLKGRHLVFGEWSRDLIGHGEHADAAALGDEGHGQGRADVSGVIAPSKLFRA